ncbi:hypothetical protein [Proteus mirabilis]|uniref:hypothetical protein n=1 Tax=Proteus mirabilis TaxID=584 RepID=UPI0018C54828|nr:hypothetical protein [Proteus mirabilis]
MAFYILIHKNSEDETMARYSFFPSELEEFNDQHGILEINKKNGEVTLIKAVNPDHGNHYFMRASRKVFVNWRNNEYPDITTWAS